MLDKIRNDLQLSVMFLLGTTSAVAIASFMVYRLLTGETSKALFDAAVIVCIAIPLAYVWVTGQARRAGIVMCVVNSANCAMACIVIGSEVAAWVYLALLTNFFITGRRLALVASAALIAFAAYALRDAGTLLEAVSRSVTWCFTAAFSYFFASRIHRDRSALFELATLDALTQVPNRRSMETALAEAIGARDAEGARSGLLVIDIDKFKAVNDRFGHAAGDAVLADIAAVLKFEMRSGDSIYRFGGEEFVALLPVNDNHALAAAGERIRKAVRANVRSADGRITVSVGGAMIDGASRWQDWFARADEALYRAKSADGDACRISGM